MRHSHIEHAHLIWAQWAEPGSWVIDATCGNGHDTRMLSELVGASGGVIALDIQEEAIKSAQKRIEAPNVHFFCQSHVSFPSLAERRPIRLIVYNLGYLPGGNKLKTTLSKTTLLSLQAALSLVEAGGLVSLTLYPGHSEGAFEEEAVKEFAAALCPRTFSVSHTRWENRNTAPSLLLIQKNCL